MSKNVGLFFMPRQFGGGSTSFTAHLFKAFEMAGIKPWLFRVTERCEQRCRPFSKYADVEYRNIDYVEAKRIVRQMPTLLTAPCHSKHVAFMPNVIKRLMKRGMDIVIHDPNEFKVYDHLSDDLKRPPICIRPTMKAFYSEAAFIPHPYVREFPLDHFRPHMKREHLAVSLARVTFVKRTHLILEANRLLEKTDKVVLRGAENRLYTRHVLNKKYPEFEQGSTGYPMTWGAAAREAEKAVFALDFTLFPDDGGGSQYSFMEAWDAGTVNIIHKDWLRYPGEMNAHPTDRARGNCIAVESPEQAADWLRLYRESSRWRADCLEIVERGKRMLASVHDPVKVAEEYWEWLRS